MYNESDSLTSSQVEMALKSIVFSKIYRLKLKKEITLHYITNLTQTEYEYSLGARKKAG